MAPIRRPFSRRRIILYIAIALGILMTLLLLGGELAARRLLPYQSPWIQIWPRRYYLPDADCGYRHPAGFPPTLLTAVDRVSHHLCFTNSLGMHDVEPPPDSRRLRILCLGCSFTEGVYQTNPGESWLRALEKILNADSRTTLPVTLMNGGVMGFNTYQQVAHGVRLTPAARPDVWLMTFMGSDLGMWGFNTFGPAGEYRLKWDILWNADHLERLLAGRSRFSVGLMGNCWLWRWICLKQSGWAPPAEHAASAIFRNQYAQATRDALALFKREADRMGVRPVLVYLPPFYEIDQNLKKKNRFVFDAVRQDCKSLGIPFIDMLSPMLARAEKLKAGEFPRIWQAGPTDQHYNGVCNGLYARDLAQRLRPLLAGWSKWPPKGAGASGPPAKLS